MSLDVDVIVGAELHTDDGAPPKGQTRTLNPRRVWLSRDGGGAAPAAGAALLTFNGGPAKGRYWEVTGITVTGGDDHTVLAGTFVAFYIGRADAANPTGLVLPGSQGGSGTTVPANAQWGRNQLACLPGVEPFILVYGAAVGQVLKATLFGWDRPLSDLDAGT